jgi:GNAT superfamily N-acetyltransferase
MVPLDSVAVNFLRSWLGEPPGPELLALHHAMIHPRPGLWGDDARTPRSVVLIREGDNQLEAFGAGEPEPALGWLAGHGRAVSLIAPPLWRYRVSGWVGAFEWAEVETWSLAQQNRVPFVPRSRRRSIEARPLTLADAGAFAEVAPAWALRSWGSFASLIEHGAAFGVPHGSGFVSLAWIFDESSRFDAIGIFTVPKFRRLGLARAASTTLLGHIIDRRSKAPLWSTTAENPASLALVQSLGFSMRSTEPLLRWRPRPGAFALAQQVGRQ